MHFHYIFFTVLIATYIGNLFSLEGAMVTSKFKREYLPCTYDFLKVVTGVPKLFNCIGHCLDVEGCITIKLIPSQDNFQCILLSNGTNLFENPSLDTNVKFYAKDTCKQWVKIDHTNADQTTETSYYHISEQYIVKDNAATKCSEFGPNVFLAEFEKREKYDALKAYMANKNPGDTNQYWIGMVYNQELAGPYQNENSYIWEQSKSQGSFKYFRSDEPSDSSIELCVRIHTEMEYRWANVRCDNLYGYICEMM